MFDIFYSGPKPNLFPHEQQAINIEHARELSRTRYFWWVNYLTDYTDHDFLWESVPWEADQTHVWPSQHQDHSGTALVPKHGGQEVNYSHPAVKRIRSVPVVGIDHGNGLDVDCDTQTRYISNYIGTLRRILSKLSDEYVWVVSSVCDYSNFDFTWHPSEWQQDMMHVFPSNEQKFGDTFYIHVPSFLKKTERLELLEWYQTIHFVEDISVPRKPIPVVYHQHDTHPQAVWAHHFNNPYVEFNVGSESTNTPPTPNLWRTEVKNIYSLTPGASRILVPRDAKNFLKKQLYDYPFIDKTAKNTDTDQLLDIVY
jgi:hypothetical protein